jgi:hypothetical protein
MLRFEYMPGIIDDDDAEAERAAPLSISPVFDARYATHGSSSGVEAAELLLYAISTIMRRYAADCHAMPELLSLFIAAISLSTMLQPLPFTPTRRCFATRATLYRATTLRIAFR